MRILLFGFSLIFASPACAGPSKRTNPHPRSNSTTLGLSVQESNAFRLLFAARKARGLPALKIDMAAVKAARAHSADMCRRGYFSHTTPEGTRYSKRLRRQGLRFRLAAENISRRKGGATVVHKGWMKSGGHRRNRMHPRYRRVGIGVHVCSGRPYWTEVLLY
jgi:uncharacterized protein YkwD